jgi:glycosyltransferase involved in cell wall biosynthesis
MRVGVFLRNYSAEEGGSYTVTNAIIQSLLDLEQESSHQFVLYGWGKEAPPTLLFSNNVQYISLAQYKLLSRIINVSKKLRIPLTYSHVEPYLSGFILNSLLKNGIDVLWEPNPNCLTMELPYIITMWDVEHRILPYFPEIQKEWDLMEQHFATRLRRASLIITQTEVGKAQIEKFYQIPTERIKVLPHPTPGFVFSSISPTRERIFEKYNLSDNYLFYPAQFWALKNHANLLLAVKSIKDRYDIIFPVVFSGSDKGNQEYISQMATELNLSKQVNFIGFIPQEDMIALYRNAFALTYVTFNGPSGLPPLEAFALGCPVISSKSEAQLGDAALLVDPREPEEIALAIKRLWDDQTLRQTLVQRGLERVTQWTSEDYVQGVFAILNEFEFIRRCWK